MRAAQSKFINSRSIMTCFKGCLSPEDFPVSMSIFRSLRFLSVAIVSLSAVPAPAQDAAPAPAAEEARLLTNIRQLTFEGKRAGEGYFSADGTKLTFQSERDPANPFYQIYLMDLETGDISRISPGTGKTTCSWIHPTEPKNLYASTHGDPESLNLQKAEIEFRASGQTRRYAWDYDEHFDIYVSDFTGKVLQQLTHERGYDAEGSYSPDGTLIAFASNRKAYAEPMSEEDAGYFKNDPAYMTDIYLMNADGSNVRQLTTSKGYDGGPFFSPDGKRITWRRFAPNGATAEVYTMNLDGSDQQQITRAGAMSWAPYFHPSGEYLIFTNNSLGFSNFELFLVDAQGKHDPVRVTYTEGFDGLPVFSPDGKRLSWTTNRMPGGASQIHIAEWNDTEARRLLALDGAGAEEKLTLQGAPDAAATVPAIRAADLRQHIEYLSSDYMEGRLTGTIGEGRATQYAAEVYQSIGLAPAGDDGSYFQKFEFTAGVSLGKGNRLESKGGPSELQFEADKDWRPLAFSRSGDVVPSEIVFAGYGIQVEKSDTQPEYDSFVHLDVKDKWVMVLRFLPEGITPELRQHLNAHANLRFKAMTLRDLGARGMIVVSGPGAKVKEQLVSMAIDTSLGGTSLAAVSVTDDAAQRLLGLAGKDLKDLQAKLDTGDVAMGFPIPDARLSATIDIVQEKRIGRNVLAKLDTGAPVNVVIGAHIDHLGVGRSNVSLAHDDEATGIHHGADDNASGTAGLFEIAQYLVDQKKGGLAFTHNVIFASWSGEELGTLGSDFFVKNFAGKKEGEALRPEIAAYLNMDMIGRLDKQLIVQGVASSSIWPGEIERRNAPIGLNIAAKNETYLPTDATPFYLKGVPVLNAFTGAHPDYHRPSDTADKINYEGAEKIAKFMSLVARSLATRSEAPDYQEVKAPQMNATGGMRVYLGSIPDYAEEVKGVKLAGITKGAPADTAGLKQGDVIVELAGRKIENIYDYTYAIDALKVGEEVGVVVERGGERISLKITPASRD